MTTDLLRDTETPSRPGSSVISAVARHPVRAPLLVGLVGFVISMVGITNPSIWYDEVATVTSATRTWAQLGEMIQTVDAVHAAYYGLMHVVFDVSGYSPLALRMPSAIAVGVAAALIVVLVRQFGGNAHALLSGLVFCTLPRVTWMGTEGRSFAITTALGVALTLVLVLAVRSGLRRWWAIYVGLGILICVTFIYSALLVVAHGVAMAWWLAAGRSAAIRDVARWGVATVVTGLLVLPLALAVVEQSGQVGWIDPLGPDTFRQIFRTQWFLYSYHFAIAAWFLIALGTVILVRRAHRFSLALLIVPLAIVPTIVLIIATAVYSPLYSPRYVTMCAPYAAILMAAPIAYLRPRLVGLVAFIVVVSLGIGPAVNERTPQAKQDSTWKEVAALIENQRADDGPAPSVAIIYGWLRRHPTATTRAIAYSYPDAFRGTVDVTLRTPAGETGHLWETRNPLSTSLDRLDGTDTAYLITSIKRDLRPETNAEMESVGWQVTAQWNLIDVNVVKYERVDAAP